MIECKICNKEFKNVNCLIWHLERHFISYQDYLKTYIWKPLKYFEYFITPGVCPICGKSFKLKIKYQQIFCCKKCQSNFFRTSEAYKQSNIEKAKQTCKLKYGVENVMDSNLFRQKIKDTKLKKYGDSNYNNRIQAVKTSFELYGFDNYNNRKKAKQTFIDLYGVDNPAKIDGISDKVKETKFEKYGDSNFNNRDLAKQTYLKKYGVDNYTQTKEYKEKNYNTKKQNHTFVESKPELKLLKILRNKFGESDIEYQYKSDLYPFVCDFYIKSLDLYIELQGSWTHGGEPYNPENPEHIKKLKIWKSKNTKFYNNAINVWTVRDPFKRLTAKENGIKLVEVFDFKTFKELKNLFKDLNLNNE